jgi:hypothetical protein
MVSRANSKSELAPSTNAKAATGKPISSKVENTIFARRETGGSFEMPPPVLVIGDCPHRV